MAHHATVFGAEQQITLRVERANPGVKRQVVLKVEHHHVVWHLTALLTTIHRVEHQVMAANYQATTPEVGYH